MTASTSTAPAGLPDRQWFAVAWYGQTLEHLTTKAGVALLRPEAAPPAALVAVPGILSGHLVAASCDVAEASADPGDVVVVGGPCIGDCTPGPTLEALYDTTQAMLLAKAWKAPAVLYLGDREEIMGAGGTGKWAKVADRFEAWLPKVAEALAFTGARVVRTSGAAHAAALDTGGHPAASLDGARLDAAFHLGSAASVLEQGDLAREVTRRVVEAHLPAVVAAHAGRATPPRVVIAENFQQVGVWQLASELAGLRGGGVGLVAHWPAPGLSASGRMYRSPLWDKIPAWELEAVAAGTLPAVHPLTHVFFAAWLDGPRRAALAAAARDW